MHPSAIPTISQVCTLSSGRLGISIPMLLSFLSRPWFVHVISCQNSVAPLTRLGSPTMSWTLLHLFISTLIYISIHSLSLLVIRQTENYTLVMNKRLSLVFVVNCAKVNWNWHSTFIVAVSDVISKERPYCNGIYRVLTREDIEQWIPHHDYIPAVRYSPLLEVQPWLYRDTGAP